MSDKTIIDQPLEVWRPVVGYEGIYEVSNLGSVKSLARKLITKNGTVKFLREKLLATSVHLGTGYVMVNLHNGHGVKFTKVHRMVAMAFLPNPENKKEVNHINGVRHDNRLENLRWCTRKESAIHCFRMKPRQKNIKPISG